MSMRSGPSLGVKYAGDVTNLMARDTLEQDRLTVTVRNHAIAVLHRSDYQTR